MNSDFALGVEQWRQLSDAAWKCRNQAYVLGKTKVGAALLSVDMRIFVGCNIEHRFRCHDVHAEVNALSCMVANGCTELKAILVVSEREKFTPCGGCMDWIFQFGGTMCLVGIQSNPSAEVKIYYSHELMPHYPI